MANHEGGDQALNKFKLEGDAPSDQHHYFPYANLENAGVLQEAGFHDPTAVRELPRNCCTPSCI